jgi:hypothetical protein
MSEPILLSTRIPQTDDSLGLLLAKNLSAPYTRTTYIAATGSITTQTTGTSIDTRALRALWVSVNVSAISVGTLSLQVQYQDPVTGNWGVVATSSTGISVAGTYAFVIGETALGNNMTVSPGGLMACRMPAALRLALVPAGGATYNASVGLETA